MKNSRIKGVTHLLFTVFIAWLSFQQLNTPAPVLPGYSPDSYSAYRAIEYLKIIAKEPHSGGTTAHKKVRNYIYDFCKKHGLKTKVYNQTGMQQYRSAVVAGNSFNVLGKLKGTESSKAVLVMSHYDSQPNTPGAADDGSGVASMLEVIDLLSKQGPLKNDIYFLFTDLEEVGLLGAEAFVHANEELNEIGLILNYESRGNAGANFTFETSSQNGWVVRQFSKAVNKPLANSLAYEIYKLMPNDTDFTMFSDTGVSGLNSAFLDGFSYYHSPLDNPQNIDLGSLQNQGDLMWQMVNHFGNIDLTNTKSEDVIFFSVFANLVIYPNWLDWPLIIISLLGMISLIYIGIKKEKLQFSNFLLALLNYILSIVLCLGLVWAFTWIVLKLNGHYTNFYSNNFYNATTYLWMYLGCSLLAFSLLGSMLFKKITTLEKIIGGLFIHSILILALKFIVPTGAFILYIPMISALIILGIQIVKAKSSPLLDYAIPIAPLILWVPFIYFLFVVFSLSLPYASVFFIILLFPYFEYTLTYTNGLHSKAVIVLSIILIVVGFGMAQATSEYTEEEPLQTQLTYALNVDKNEAVWVSRQKNKDEFISKYIKSDSLQRLTDVYPQSSRLYWLDRAPVVSLPTAEIKTAADTIIADTRTIKLEIKPTEGVTYFNLILPEGTGIISVNEREIENPVNHLIYYAPANSICRLKMSSRAEEALEVILVESHWGIGNQLLTTPLPPNFIFGTGTLSNNKLVKQTIRL